MHDAAALLALLLSAAPAAAPSLSVGPVGAWVEPAPVPEARIDPAKLGGGVHHLLLETQVLARGERSERYVHLADRVLTSEGVGEASEVRASFDPSYQRLVMHRVRILRGAAAINALHPQQIKLIQQEEGLDERIYDGRLTALLFLDDVRVGDVVEVDYTVLGDNPVFAGRFTEEVLLAGSRPLERLRYRLLWPRGRPLHYRVLGLELEPARRVRGEQEELDWSLGPVSAVELEDDTPPWYDPFPVLQISEHESWAEVADWASALFQPDEQRPSAPLARQIEAWSKLETKQARMMAALRFVQGEVRYLGIEMGRGSHQPASPSKVYARRFGDCKDKALLLSTVLRSLGIEAHPALVSTTRRRALDAMLPSSTVFDHVVVAAKQDAGSWIWMDATSASERGGAEQLDSLPFERALILAPGTSQLTQVPAPTVPALTELEEVFDVRDYHSEVSFAVRTRFTGAEAEANRVWLTETPLDELSRRFLNHYASRDPKISIQKPAVVLDDELNNAISVEEHYLIPDFWDGVHRELYAGNLNSVLVEPRILRRHGPLRLPHPVELHTVVTVHLPNDWEIEPEIATVDDRAFHYELRVGYAQRTLRVEHRFQSKADHVEAAQLEDYLRKVRAVKAHLGYEIAYRVTAPRRGNGLTWGLALPLLLAIGLGFLLRGRGSRSGADRRAERRQRSFRESTRHQPGETASLAIEVNDEAALRGHASGLRCEGCAKKRLELTGIEPVLLGDRRLQVASLSCAACGASSRRYFSLRGD